MRSLKIASIMSWLPCEGNWGGVGYHVHRLSNLLVRRGHTVDIYSASAAPPDALYTVKRLASDAQLSSKLFMSYGFPIRVSRRDFSGYDIVHAHGDNQWLRTKTPLVRTFYGSALGEAMTSGSLRRFISQMTLYPCEWIASRRASVSIGISRITAKHIPWISRTIPCGVNLDEFSPGTKSEVPCVLFVGYLHGRKRGEWFARMFVNEIRKELPNSELWMVSDVGAPMDGVKWWGKPETSVLVDLYRRAWVFCLPSTYEGFGIPYVEAMASGTCVVASPNAGASEVLADGRFGMIVHDRDLAGAIVDLLSSEARRDELAAQGIGRAAEYSFDRIAQEYEEVFELVRGGAAG